MFKYFWLSSILLGGLLFSPLKPQPLQEQPEQETGPVVEETVRLENVDFEYLGAFRLPADQGNPPRTFAYSGNAMTYNPKGDPSGTDDGFPGSLFITGHDRMAYGDLPDGDQVAEISIPIPKISRSTAVLRRSRFLQGFRNIAAGYFRGLDEIPRVGMQYLYTPLTGPRIHIAWGQHLQNQAPSHAWFTTNLSNPKMTGTWYIGSQSPYSTTGYMLEIPSAWARLYTQGRLLGTGRFRDGGWSGMGPSLFAYKPWDASGKPYPNGTHLKETVLLLYQNSITTGKIEKSLKNYQHPDEWEGATWVTTPSGKSAVLFAGTKGIGAKYWYGWTNPTGPQYPCVETEMLGQFTLCRLADGSPCPAQDLKGCKNHNDYRGWWSTRFEARFILYDPIYLAKVALKKIQPYQPQPYTSYSLESRLFHNPDRVEEDMLGKGVQRRFRIGDVTYDRKNGLLYVLELYAEEARPVVHVWRLH